MMYFCMCMCVCMCVFVCVFVCVWTCIDRWDNCSQFVHHHLSWLDMWCWLSCVRRYSACLWLYRKYTTCHCQAGSTRRGVDRRRTANCVHLSLWVSRWSSTNQCSVGWEEVSLVSAELLSPYLPWHCSIVVVSVIVTSSSAIAEGPRTALSQLKSCQLLHKCTKNHIWPERLPFHVV